MYCGSRPTVTRGHSLPAGVRSSFEGRHCVLMCFCSSLYAELIIPATGNVFYAMTTSSVDFLLRKKEGDAPLGSQPISTETSATFPRIKAKGRRLVRTLF